MSPVGVDGLLAQTRQPQFIDSAYFLRFKFEQGKYALVGRETFDGLEVLRIEYYPDAAVHARAGRARHEREEQKKRQDRGEDYEAQMERLMNKVSLVTLWVEPTAQQIVKYTFDNVNLDFLPAAWLVAHQRPQGDDDDEPAVPGRLAAARRRHVLRGDAGDRRDRRPLPPRLPRLSPGDDERPHQGRRAATRP